MRHCCKCDAAIGGAARSKGHWADPGAGHQRLLPKARRTPAMSQPSGGFSWTSMGPGFGPC